MNVCERCGNEDFTFSCKFTDGIQQAEFLLCFRCSSGAWHQIKWMLHKSASLACLNGWHDLCHENVIPRCTCLHHEGVSIDELETDWERKEDRGPQQDH